jgi:hypothetical protein
MTVLNKGTACKGLGVAEQTINVNIEKKDFLARGPSIERYPSGEPDEPRKYPLKLD